MNKIIEILSVFVGALLILQFFEWPRHLYEEIYPRSGMFCGRASRKLLLTGRLD